MFEMKEITQIEKTDISLGPEINLGTLQRAYLEIGYYFR